MVPHETLRPAAFVFSSLPARIHVYFFPETAAPATTCGVLSLEETVDARGSDAVAVVAELCIQAGQL